MNSTVPPTQSSSQSDRRGHNPQISISDADHHVTEAIGGMYDTDEEDGNSSSRPNSRPLSYVFSPKESYSTPSPPALDSRIRPLSRTPLSHTIANERVPSASPSLTSALLSSPKKSIVGSENVLAASPPSLTNLVSGDMANQQFPLNDVDYVAQELSNLQAIRRMSMSVDTADPDLPGFNAAFNGPPSPNADEDDASRLFWVPARLHPELAPTEFKTFIEDRVDKMRRRSEEGGSNFMLHGLEKTNSSNIKRKKSMLSRQIDPLRASDEHIRALERKTSEASASQAEHDSDLTTLAHLVGDPTSLMRTLSIDSTRKSQDSGIGVPITEDTPMLGSLSQGLKRSTRTNYRRGSLRKGEPVPRSKRAIGRDAERDSNSGPDSPSLDEPLPGVQRALTEPIHPPQQSPTELAENFSRPGRNRHQGLGICTSAEDLAYESRIQQNSPPFVDQQSAPEVQQSGSTSPQPPFRSRIAAGGRTTASLPGDNAPVPHILETPPSIERPSPSTYVFPLRGSSRQPPPAFPPPRAQRIPLIDGARSRPSVDTQKDQQDATLSDLSSNPRILPGSGNMRTDDLTLVPTYDDRKQEKKETTRKTSWGWFLGGEKEDKREEKEKEREREKEKKKSREAKAREDAREKEKEKEKRQKEKDKEQSRKPKVSSKLAPPDIARLDVLQNSIDGSSSRGRESIVLDRESVRLDVERKRESSRKSSEPSGKKEKDGSILSVIFGGAKRSKDDHSKNRSSSRGLSPEPPPRYLRPDLDYNWTRFSILEERAIYRLAHIKLANPRRALYSQVLLSNFMYSYLAKVQMMHPQAVLQGKQPQHAPSASQKSAVRQDDKPAEFVQYQRWQEVRDI